MQPDQYSLVEKWVYSLKTCGIEGVIFHDQLSRDFCQLVSSRSDELISFVKASPSPGISNNDYSFKLYYKWCIRNKPEYLFCTDLFDVQIRRSPLAIIDEDHDLWISIENDWKFNYDTPSGEWVMGLMINAYGCVPPEVLNKTIFNAGVWGGKHNAVLDHLGQMNNEFERIHNVDPRLNSNMSVFNLVTRRNKSKWRIWSEGYPLHSAFMRYEDRDDVCFIHK